MCQDLGCMLTYSYRVTYAITIHALVGLDLLTELSYYHILEHVLFGIAKLPTLFCKMIFKHPEANLVKLTF